MDRAKKTASKAKNATLNKNRFASFAYVPKKLPVVPFGLSTDNSAVLSGILERDSLLKEAMTGLMSEAKAPGTMVSYDRMTRKFSDFCSSSGYMYPKFSEAAVLHFTITLDKEKASWATICQVKPALSLVEKMTGTSNTAFLGYGEYVFASSEAESRGSQAPGQESRSFA